MSRGEPVPEILVERLRLGELGADEAARVRARLEARGELGRVEALAAEDLAIYARYPSLPREVVARALAERAKGPRREARAGTRPGAWAKVTRWVPLGAVVAVTAMLASRAPIPQESSHGAHDSEAVGGPGVGDRAKGGPALFVWVEREGNEPRRLLDRDRAEAGDRVQLVFERGELQAAALYSIDGRGTITEHLPPSLVAPRVVLSSSYVLDDAPGFERFLLVLASAPFTDDDRLRVRSSIERLAASPDGANGALEIPHMTVVSVLLDKGRATR